MNLINKLTIDYRSIANIVNPFYLSYTAERETLPVYSIDTTMPRSFMTKRQQAIVEFAVHPDNININIDGMGQIKELTIFNKGNLVTLQSIYEVKCNINYSTQLYEFEIRCTSLLLGGEQNE